jgi:Zn-dependent peptidase ImmA (M78 family)
MSDSIPVVLKDLPTRIRGFVCLGSDYNPCIIINSRLPVEQQRRTYRHEMEHISSGQLDDDSYVEYGGCR